MPWVKSVEYTGLHDRALLSATGERVWGCIPGSQSADLQTIGYFRVN